MRPVALSGRAWLPLGLLLAGLLLTPPPARAQARQLLFLETFNALAAPAAGGAAAALPRWWQGPHLRLMPGAGRDGSTALQVTYVPSPEGSERIAINLPLRRAVTRARLSFDVRFAEGFRFARGGKLLGLGPARPVTGGAARRPDGWSARAMWREQGRIATYLYEQQGTKRFGIGQLSREPVLNPGEWHHISLDLRLNEPGQADGAALLAVDGRPVALSQGLSLRGASVENLAPIGQLLLHTFFGGSDPSYQPRDADGRPLTLTALFDNLQVTSDQPISAR